MLKINFSSLEQVAGFKSQYPKEKLPEIAFAGRSNVGKSSMINAVLARKNLARTSSKPGKTRTVNFYLANDEFRLVDLPGYGFASAPKSEIIKWAKIIEEYLEDRENLREIFLVVDIRHRPTDDDLDMYEYIIANGFTGYVIATKADKISKGKFDKAKKEISEKLGVERDKIIPFSAENKTNREKILSLIEKIIKNK